MDRRDELIRIMQESENPMTGTDLAQRFGVTRQVIVQDIAVLRAKGFAIVATPQGYFQPKPIHIIAQDESFDRLPLATHRSRRRRNY